MIQNNEKIEELWNIFKTGIQEAMDEFIPSKIFKKKNTVPWFNRNLKRMTRRKARLSRYAKNSKQWSEFKQYQKLCKREFQKAEVDYVNKTIKEGFHNNNSKPFLRYVKAKHQDYIGVVPLKVNGILHSESKDTAQVLVEQFYSVFTKVGSKVLSKLPKQSEFDLPGLTITATGVEKITSKDKHIKSNWT